MPVYEYECLQCSGNISVVVQMSEDEPRPERKCYTCGGVLKLCISIPGQPNFGFRPFVTEHITGESVDITSRSHKRQLLAKYGLEESV